MYIELGIPTLFPCNGRLHFKGYKHSLFATFYHDLNGISGSSFSSFECLQSFLELETMGDEGLYIDTTGGNHLNGLWIAIGVAENASDVHFTHGSINDGNLNLVRAETDQDLQFETSLTKNTAHPASCHNFFKGCC